MFASTTIEVAWAHVRWTCTKGRPIRLSSWAGEDSWELNVLRLKHFSIVLLMIIVAAMITDEFSLCAFKCN